MNELKNGTKIETWWHQTYPELIFFLRIFYFKFRDLSGSLLVFFLYCQECSLSMRLGYWTAFYKMVNGYELLLVKVNLPDRFCNYTDGPNKSVEQTAWRPRFYEKALQLKYLFRPLLTPDVESVEKAIDWRIFYAKFQLLPQWALMLFLGDKCGSI